MIDAEPIVWGVAAAGGAEAFGISSAADAFTSSLGWPLVGRIGVDSAAFIGGWSFAKIKNILARGNAPQSQESFNYPKANEEKPFASQFGKFFGK